MTGGGGDQHVEPRVTELLHREVVVRFTGPHGRTTIGATIVDVAADTVGDVDAVEVDTVPGHLFPLSAVTLLDDIIGEPGAG
jgi:hypothetical protein